MDEKSLVRRCRAGAPGARQEMYETFAGRVLAVCRRYIRDTDRARDLVHDTFLRAWDSYAEELGWRQTIDLAFQYASLFPCSLP